MLPDRLSLEAARASGRLDDFAEQEEARGVGQIARAAFDAATANLIKAPRSKDQTSHSDAGGNLPGKKTPRGSDQGAGG